MTYRATDSIARSNCSLTCKFSYVSPGVNVKHLDGKEETSEGWSRGFLNKIGTSSVHPCPIGSSKSGRSALTRLTLRGGNSYLSSQVSAR